MKEKLFTFFWSVGLSFVLSFGAVACLVTGFSMAVPLWELVLWCFLGSVVFSVCFALPLGALPPAALALAGGFLWQAGPLKLSIEAICYRISRIYHQAYGWPIIKLNVYTADDMETMLTMVVIAIALLIAWLITWAISRKTPVFPGILLSLLPLAACFVVTDTVPQTSWLWLYLTAFVMILISHTTRRRHPKQGDKLCAFAILPVALCMLILFAAMPQDNYHGAETAKKLSDSFMQARPVQWVMELFQQTPASGSVSENQVDLSSVGLRMESKAEMMTVTADNYTGTLYLRGRSYNTYDGWHWSFTGKDTFSWPSEFQLEQIGEVEISTKYAHRMLYTPYYPQSISLSESPEGFKNEKQLTHYSYPCAIASKRTGLFEDQLGNLTITDGFVGNTVIAAEGNIIQLPDNIVVLAPDAFVHLPEKTVDWAKALLSEIPGAQSNNIYQKAQAIADYVRRSATYNTNISRMPRNKADFAKWFLEEQDEGYCVHFATATTVLLQAAGIPARYVTGYMAHVTAGEPSKVLLKDSHAWTEYFLPGFGWSVLESTPSAVSTPEPEQQATDPASSAENTTPETRPQQTAPVPQAPSQTLPQGSKFDPAYLWLLLIPAVIGLLWLQRVLRLRIRAQRLCQGSPNIQALALWQETVFFAKCLRSEPPQDLFDLAQKAKYSPHTLTAEELAQFNRFLQAAVAALKKQSIFHQFYYRLVLCIY